MKNKIPDRAGMHLSMKSLQEKNLVIRTRAFTSQFEEDADPKGEPLVQLWQSSYSAFIPSSIIYDAAGLGAR